MSVTGIALILFMTFHASMNVVALFSAKGYNLICEFLGANWYAVAATIGLAALVAVHFIYALWLTIQNRRARGNNKYAVTEKPEKVEWASQNMLVLGIIICLGLCLHLFNFWYKMMYAELAGVEPVPGVPGPTDGVGHIINTFSCPVYTVLYLIWLCAIWFHMNHGMWSSMQTLGWSGKVWLNRWRVISCIYTTVVILMFAAVILAFSFGYRPSDYKAACCHSEMACPQHKGCPEKMVCPGRIGCPGHDGEPCPQGPGAPAPEPGK